MSSKCVMTIDIKGSRKLNPSERESLHFSIFKTIDAIPKEYASEILAIGMTTGDEFQVVIAHPHVTVDIYGFIKRSILAPCYIGVGFGEVTDYGTRTPSEMYGEAFYRSRSAIDKAKKTMKNGGIHFILGEEILDKELNTLFDLIQFIQNKQTKRQKEVIAAFTEQMNLKAAQKHTARTFGVSEPAISKILANSGYESISRAEELARFLLEKRLENKFL